MSAKEKLAEALETLMDEHALDDIHVTDIARLAGVSKQTFYHHFEDKYDLMEYCHGLMFDPTFEKMNVYYPFSASCRDLYARYREKERFLRNAFASKDANGLIEVMRRSARATYTHYLAVQGVEDEGDVSFMLDLFTIGAVELTRQWVNRGMDTPDDKLIELWLKSLPAPIAPYFK